MAAALASNLARAQTTERVSVDTGGTEGNSGSALPSLSADGRFVAFVSYASNLVAGDNNGAGDIFVRDLQAGSTERVSVATGGAEANSECRWPSISADGRFVAFMSYASNLVTGDTNGFQDAFVRDRQLGTTERVSVATGGAQANASIDRPSISDDGSSVGFYSDATNLVTGDTNGFSDVFVRDRLSGTTERVSVATNGTQGNSFSADPKLSADGRFVAFYSSASNLVAGDTLGYSDIFVRDRLSMMTERISVATSGVQGNDNSGNGFSTISADGRFVAFTSYASNFVAGDTNGWQDIFVRDRVSGTTNRASVNSAGAQGNSESWYPSISANGRFVAFDSHSSNLDAADTNATVDVFVRDILNGTTERVSVSTGGAQGNAASRWPSISDDGRSAAFYSDATNLVAGDLNGFTDVFVRDGGQPSVDFCFGDGTGTACPCGSGTAGNGCPSSVNASGANLAASGTASTTADTLVLLGSGMPNSSALYFQGTTQVAGGVGVVFGDGLRCAGGTVVRLGAQLNSGGASRYPEVGDPSVSVRGLVTSPGIRTYQVWYRNAAAYCTPSTFNLTNGLEVAWTL